MLRSAGMEEDDTNSHDGSWVGVKVVFLPSRSGLNKTIESVFGAWNPTEAPLGRCELRGSTSSGCDRYFYVQAPRSFDL